MMRMTEKPVHPDELCDQLRDPAAGAYVAFEGWIRNLNEGQRVIRLEYEVYAPLCESEGRTIMDEARSRWQILHAACVHRSGSLDIGDCAVWVGVSSVHRDEAFDACRYIIDQVKLRLPIWKKEYYADGDSGWVNCERCASHEHDHPRVERGHAGR